MLYTAVAYAFMAAWGVFTQTTAGTQPLITSTVIGAGSNIYKLQQLFPPGPSESGGASGKLPCGSPCRFDPAEACASCASGSAGQERDLGKA